MKDQRSSPKQLLARDTIKIKVIAKEFYKVEAHILGYCVASQDSFTTPQEAHDVGIYWINEFINKINRDFDSLPRRAEGNK